jgi:galactokinase
VQVIKDVFLQRFDAAPYFVVRAPGRVNLIGEHTDYTGGFVFPAAIDRDMVIAARPVAGDVVTAYSLDLDREDCFSLAHLEHASEPDKMWSNYLRGVMHVLLGRGIRLQGFEAVLSGNVPQGAGLSSSAAFEVAAIVLLNAMYNLGLDLREIALLAQKSENEFVKVQCGIMDQFISALGRADSALLIDCRSLDYKVVPLNLDKHGLNLVIINSGVTRGLVDSEYNKRRQDCIDGAKLVGKELGKEINSLRDISVADLARCGSIEEPVRSRIEHVVFENQRVLDAVAALENEDHVKLGSLMNESHDSLSRFFAVSCAAVDKLVELTQAMPGVLGSRMTGAGFGGCTVSLIESAALSDLKKRVLTPYFIGTGCKPEVYICKASAGASLC